MTQLHFTNPDFIPIIFLMGGTATGKTDIAALLTQDFPAELVSVDSSLVYKGMDIGTAKPDSEFLEKFPHHLIDVRDPDETYSAADFCQDAKVLVNEITGRGNVPIFVGGTSFYFAALENGLPDLPEKNSSIREEILLEAEKVGWSGLHDQLMAIDPRSAKRINSNDPQRIQRALEINRITGEPVKEKSKAKKLVQNPIIKIALTHFDRKILHQRIEKRFHIMVEQGLVSEIENLLSCYSADIPAFRMIGYRQFIEGYNNGDSIDRVIEKSIIATRQLAKRQLTWLRNQSGILWHGVDSANLDKTASSIAKYSQDWLKIYQYKNN